MDPDAQTLGYIIAAVAVVLLALAVIWFSRRRPAAHAGLAPADRDAAHRRELDSLREQHTLIAERLDRFERMHTDEREDLVRLRETHEARMQRIEMIERQHKELQEQIFELRETQKVLLQRDDRHERTVQEVQAELTRHVAAAATR